MNSVSASRALIFGASRGLGLALVREYLDRGWTVTATVRSEGSELGRLAAERGDRLRIERVDINRRDEVATLRRRLEDKQYELVFVNAGITRGNLPVGEVATEDFLAVMETNVLSVMRVVEAFGELATEAGTVGVMSSRQGSLTLNTRGGEEVYRASKSALNQLMRSYAVRHQEDARSLILMSPGWVRTGLGGDKAPYAIGETIPGVVDTIARHAGESGLRFLDWQGETVPW